MIVVSFLAQLPNSSDVNITRGSSPVTCPQAPPTDTSLQWLTCYSPGDQVTLIITGLATIQDYQELLRSTLYWNTAQEPDKDQLNRVISVSAAIRDPVSIFHPSMLLMCAGVCER